MKIAIFLAIVSFATVNVHCFAEDSPGEGGDAELFACYQRVEAKYHRDVKKCGVKSHFECAKELLDREGNEFEMCRQDSRYLNLR